jgi:tetratricopeptide (TPR) repeat protein
MRKILTIVLILSFSNAIACLNEYRTKLTGEVFESELGGGAPYADELDASELQKELARLDSLFKIDKSHETLSDYGVILIYLGRYNEAIDLYRRIEREKPGLYATAANIGTAFELIGQNDSAYHYIAKAISIDPNSHEGSEWIHLKILEAKNKLGDDPNYLEDNSILGLDFGDAEKPVDPSKTDLYTLEDQLRFQLRERMTFVKPMDIVVGQLLFDLGNIQALTRDVQSALECYEYADKYGYKDHVMDKRIGAFKPLALKATIANESANSAKQYPWLTLIGVGVLGIGLVVLVRKIVRRRTLSK